MNKKLEKQIQEYLKQTQYCKTKERILRQKEEALS